MSVIDEKQEAIACIRMAVDNDNLAQLNSDASDDDVDLEVDPEFESQHWHLGSPEGKKSNLRVMSAELGSNQEEYRCLDERVRDFIACHMPEEAMRYEEDIYVSLSTDFTGSSFFNQCRTLHRFGDINVLLSNTSQRLTGLRQETSCAVILISMADGASIVLLSTMMPLGSPALVFKV